FDKEPEEKVQNGDDYDVLAIDCQHSEQSKSVHNTYLIEQDAQTVLIESKDMNYDNFKTKNKSLTEANNQLSEVNAHLYADYKNSKDELKCRNTVEYATEMELECAKLRAGSKDRPPMLAPGNYIQWKSRIKRYIDTNPNREHIHYCLENPPYELGWKDKYINDAEGNPTTATHQVFETLQNVEQVIRDRLNAEVEAVQIIL
nr:hypothetical protein [Tanacetum cinerariifolium]